MTHSTKLIAIGVLFYMPAVVHAGPVMVLDDKSDFAGHDYTLIDFESCCGGVPIVLDEGRVTLVFPEFYANDGVLLSASAGPFIANLRGPVLSLALERGGSPQNALFTELLDEHESGHLRFDFAEPINALGFSIINRLDGLSPRLDIFDVDNQLIASQLFDSTLVDGVVHGALFDDPYDWEYGFFGLYSPDAGIAYAILHEDRTVIDDLHFGIIPEPAPATYTLVGALLLAQTYRIERAASCHRE